ncbi:hypothetical protein PQI07_12065 [Methylobacterium sp. 092160098-2]|uniref:hypothetical protein n=1 Tax=Methylobacterium TaxID=407 RepID=UPI002381C2BC|nr:MULTISPECIES: hypothetical protein [Methylobacterium]MDE4911426.1 hypothetical protein [Methylobacterium sp. 092160098-2]MDH3030866.1 hypothetical protein [Methylobacterium fujisawaense]
MRKRPTARSGTTTGPTRKREPPPRGAPARPEAAEAVPPVRAPNAPDWANPLTEEERRALEAGWGFVE